MEPWGLQKAKASLCSPSGVSRHHIPWWNFIHSGVIIAPFYRELGNVKSIVEAPVGSPLEHQYMTEL